MTKKDRRLKVVPTQNVIPMRRVPNVVHPPTSALFTPDPGTPLFNQTLAAHGVPGGR